MFLRRRRQWHPTPVLLPGKSHGWRSLVGCHLWGHRKSDMIKLVNSKGNQPWIFCGRTDAKAEAPILWPPDTKSWLIGKDPNAGKTKSKRTKVSREWEWLDCITASLDVNLGKLWEIVKDREVWCAAGYRVRHNLATEQQHVPNEAGKLFIFLHLTSEVLYRNTLWQKEKFLKNCNGYFQEKRSVIEL